MTFAWLECLDSFYVDLIIFASSLGIAGAGAKLVGILFRGQPLVKAVGRWILLLLQQLFQAGLLVGGWFQQ